MGTEEKTQTVKAFLKAMGAGDRQALLDLAAEEIEWIIPGTDWPLAGTYHGHSGLDELLRRASEAMETSFTTPPEFVAQGNRVIVIGGATGKVTATDKPWEDNWVFAITVHDGKLTHIREYIDTQALALAAVNDRR